MTFINVDNSKSIAGSIFSVQLKSGHGAVYWRSEDKVSLERISRQVMNLAHGQATVAEARYIESTIDSLLNFTSERSLYSVQSMLNGNEWKECGIEIQVNFVHATGLAIGIKSLWQEPVTITYN